MFHHAQGRTPGVLEFAERLRGGGHTVHVPDLYEGRTFDDLDAGVAHLEQLGFPTVASRALAAVESLPPEVAYVGMSMGTNCVEVALLERPDALGAVLLYGQLSPAVLEVPALRGLRTQVQHSADDPWIDDPADVVVREMSGELFVYPGSAHLLADPVVPDYDPAVADEVIDRVLAFLDRLVGR